jgi:hypothetical protein
MLDFALLVSLQASKPDGKPNRGGDSAFPFFTPYLLKMFPVFVHISSGSISPADAQEGPLLCFPDTKFNTIWNI